MCRTGVGMHRVEPRALRRTDWTANAQPAMLRQVSGVGRVLHRWHRALATRSAVPMDRCLHRTVTRSNTVLELLGVRGPTPCRCICSTRRSPATISARCNQLFRMQVAHAHSVATSMRCVLVQFEAWRLPSTQRSTSFEIKLAPFCGHRSRCGSRPCTRRH